MLPVSGPTWPIFTSIEGAACGAVAAGATTTSFLDSCFFSLQPATPAATAAAMSVNASFARSMLPPRLSSGRPAGKGPESYRILRPACLLERFQIVARRKANRPAAEPPGDRSGSLRLVQGRWQSGRIVRNRQNEGVRQEFAG